METILEELKTALGTAVQRFHDELKSVRANRPSVALLEDVKVSCYGEPLTIRQLGSLSVRPPRDIEVTVWDKNAAGPVAKAIEETKMGLTVSADGNIVRATLPPLTDERRAEFTKLVKKMAEEVRIHIRGKRDEAIKKIRLAEGEKKLDEDQAFKAKEQIQKLVDEANKKIEGALEGKLQELSQ